MDEFVKSIVDGSFLEEYDDPNAAASFRRTLTTSIAYALQARGISAQDCAPQGDFQNPYAWNMANQTQCPARRSVNAATD